MSDRVHRLSMFVGGLCSGFVGIAGVGDLIDVRTLAYIALVGATAVLGGNLWRINFPDAKP